MTKLNEQDKPETSTAVAGRLHTFVSWPRGKYNGRRIDGFKIHFDMHLLWWNWVPRARFNFGEPYIIWLCFTLRTHIHYEPKQYK